MANIQEKIQSLYADLEATVEKYNEALGVVNVSKEKIIALQGALEALRSLQEEDNIVAANAIVDASWLNISTAYKSPLSWQAKTC